MPDQHTLFPQLDICSLSESKQDTIIVSRLAAYLDQHQNLIFPHRHNFYQMVLFTSGSGSHTIDFRRFDVQPSQIYFMVPAQVHAWFFEGDVDGYVVNFTDTFFQSFILRPDYLESFSFFNGITAFSVINLKTEIETKLVTLLDECMVQAQLKNHLQQDMIRAILLQIFITVEQNASKSNSPQTSQNTLVRNFQKAVDCHYLKLRLPGEYAQLLNVTPNHLNALSKEHLGKQAGELIRERIILEAKRLLVNLDLTISQIAYKLNFSDNSYFSKFFRKYTGSSPEEFRKRSVYQHL